MNILSYTFNEMLQVILKKFISTERYPLKIFYITQNWKFVQSQIYFKNVYINSEIISNTFFRVNQYLFN